MHQQVGLAVVDEFQNQFAKESVLPGKPRARVLI
jgi:hypothetical protein